MEKVQRLFREKWGKVTDADWYKIAGKRDQLIGHIQERYGMAREQAQKEVDEFVRRMHAFRSLARRR